jgi:DNA-binding Lrp family transcriptional regulator
MAISSHELSSEAGVRARFSNRLSVAFVLDVVAGARGERDLVDTLLANSIAQANLAVVTRQADLQAAYATLSSPTPEGLYRPVSINALASSLGLPFETVRRRVRNLVVQGVCRVADGGVIIEPGVMSTAAYAVVVTAMYERLRAFYYELRDADCVPLTPRPRVIYAGGEAPVRAVTRQVIGYILRVVELLMQAVDNLVSVALLFAIFRANVEHVSSEVRRREGLEPGEVIPDGLRRPARLSEVSGRLGLAAETARRHVSDLIAQGWVIRTKGGLIMTAEALARPEITRFMEDNQANLQRLFASLAQLGVLAAWDDLQPPAGAALRIPQNG